MLYVHERNLTTKINTRPNGYKGLKSELQSFYTNEYLSMRERILALTFDEQHLNSFKTATDIFNGYCTKLNAFSHKYKIQSQSKFESTFLEEISAYLFKDLKEIKEKVYDIFNKGIYAGLKVNNKNDISIITKDVDFCIGRKIDVTIDDAFSTSLILPIVSVEVKTYLDATMFGEVKSSSKSLRSASPESRAYVLMGYKDLADEHIIAARQDSTLNEMFALRANVGAPIDAGTIFEYWKEIANAVSSVSKRIEVVTPGRLLRRI